MKVAEADCRGGRDRERGLVIGANPYNVVHNRDEWQAWRQGWSRVNDRCAHLSVLFNGWGK